MINADYMFSEFVRALEADQADLADQQIPRYWYFLAENHSLNNAKFCEFNLDLFFY